MKRKSSLQLEALEKFYAEQKHPTHKSMEELSVVLELTYKQVQGWFIEKRRRDKSKNKLIIPPYSSKKLLVAKGGTGSGVVPAARRMLNQHDSGIDDTDVSNSTSSLEYNSASSEDDDRVYKRKKKLNLLQDKFTPDYILTRIFRKDGPPLGVEFDSIPRAFRNYARSTGPVCLDNQGTNKRKKVAKYSNFDAHDCNRTGAVKKHGMGKGLMTLWKAINPQGGDIPTSSRFANKKIIDLSQVSQVSTPVLRKPQHQNRRRQQSVSIMRKLANKLKEKRKPSIKRREVVEKRDEIQKQPYREKCELALEGEISEEHLNQFALLADDEELELRELQAGPNPVACSDHCATNGQYGCSLCKDLLAKFPPDSVKMKQPLTAQPWNSSLETVKKLFKVFHFLYTYSVTVDICPFTLDEFAQAFHDKDSMLLGKIHVALLKLLLSDVEKAISSGLMPDLSLSCKFLALLHSVENQEFIVEFWKSSINPLTWTEILRQVLVAAGFGSKQSAFHKEALSKEMSLMVKYGLHPGTLKGELFKILLENGNIGLKVSDLAKSSQIVKLNLTGTAEELELLICLTLSSDITLFEKISSSAYRLRINTLENGSYSFQSDSEDSGSVHNDFNGSGSYSSSDSECDSTDCSLRKLKNINCCKNKNNILTVYEEIDESHPGEVWLLGLMEGEYSDLSIEEKLNSLVALIDLLSSGSSIRVEDPKRLNSELVPNLYYHGSGGKIKKGSTKQRNLHRPSWVHEGNINAAKACTSSDSCPVDSSMTILKNNGKDKLSNKERGAGDTEHVVSLHAMQSIFLGSDRRYNRYWLFLGPCISCDPGHKRVYFESSEDGHWEVIDTEEALRALLAVLDDRGKREAFLIESLEKRIASLCQEMSSNNAEVRHSTPSQQSGLEIFREESSSPVSDVDSQSLTWITKDSFPPSGAIILEAGKKGEEENQGWIRLQEFDAWIWNCFYCDLNAVKHSKRSYFESLTRCETCHDLYWRDEKHCRICHTTFELDFDLEERYAIHSATCRQKGDNQIFQKHKVLPSQLQSLKAAVHAIESVMPKGALVGAWTKSAHRLWVRRLRRTSSLAELLQVVADFVAAINEDWLYQCSAAQVSNTFMEKIVACFPTMPQTSSALALWLVKLDELIFPYLESVQCEKKQDRRNTCTGKIASKL